MTRRRTIVTAIVLTGVLGLSACGTNREEGAGAAAGGGQGAPCDTSKGELIIGSVTPLSGDLSALGLGIRNSVELAVRQANENCAVPGYRLRQQPEDDQGLPQIANQAATRLSSNPQVVGIVGTLNSSTSQTVQPVMAERGIVMISPANTNPTLSRGQDPVAAPERPFANYFRVAATDSEQGPYAAQYLVQTAGKRNIAVITDGKTYGVGLASAFAAEAERLGATIVAREQVGEEDRDFSGVIANIRGANPDAVYYGGEYPAAGPMSAQLAAAGLSVPLMGGDALDTPEFIKLGGREGDFVTTVGAPPEDLPSAQQFITDYAAGGFTENFETYGPLSFDAANAIIRGLAASLGDGQWSEDSRAGVVAAVQQISFQGASGEVSFDEYGDTTNKVLTVKEVEGGALSPIATGVYEPQG